MKKKLWCVVCLCSLVSMMLCACGKKEEKEASIVKTYEVTDSDTAFANDEPVTIVKYYEMSDCTWRTDTHTYQYRLEITGRMGGQRKTVHLYF
jgi:hypothetical protein